jgi:hypothetical protein
VSTTFDEGGGYFGIVSLEGLGAPELNIQSQKSPYQDGSVPIDRIYAARDITLQGKILAGQNHTVRYNQTRLLSAILNPKLGPGSLVYTNNYGSYYISALPEGPALKNKNANDGNQDFQVVFHCEYPFFQDVADTTVSLNSLLAHVLVTITGDYVSPITAIVTGSGSYPMVGEDISGKYIKYNKAMSTGSLAITTSYGNKKALLTVGSTTTNVINDISNDSDFILCLNPGINYLYVSGVGSYVATITYRQNYAGV